MTVSDLNNLACELSAVSVFRSVIKTKVMTNFLAFLSCQGDACEQMKLFGEFVYSLAEDNYSFSDFLCRNLYQDENEYIKAAAQNKTVSPALLQNADAELKLFSKLTELKAKDLCEAVSYSGYVPEFDNSHTDFTSAYAERIKNVDRYGYGVFSGAKMFRINDGEIIPVLSADEISPDNFIGYDTQRKKVFDNTEALINGKPAANVLLFGDAGTGKSSTVKACANYFYDKGIRLIELRRDQLLSLSYVMDKIANNPLKFIIFIDDLSFNKNDDSFSMLKAVLEGSAAVRAKNAVIYATSNRRHIVKESFSERLDGDDVHRNDTMQELMSLSDRFGLKVYFEKPDKNLYLTIVHKMAEKNNIAIPQSELDIKAEAFALQKGSRSPRAAEQFISSLL